MSEYIVRRERARKLWVPYSGWRWPPPRLVQLARVLRCAVRGHDWSQWSIDDMDGPGEYMADDPEAFMPYLSRESRPGEFGTRGCQRDCGALETRWPVEQAPPLFKGRRVVERCA